MDDRHGSSAGSNSATSWMPSRDGLEILAMLSSGQTVESIARQRGVSERTIRRRLRAMIDRLDVDSAIEVVVFAVRSGWI